MKTLKKLMAKLLKWFDQHFLKIGVGLLLFFIPLYPKLPLFGVEHTWTYIRLEDVLVALVAGGWLVQLMRRKETVKSPLTPLIFLYWLIGGLSLLFCLFFLQVHLANFFPNVAIFHYLRRIEYMVLFLVAFASVKNLKTVRQYLVVLGITVLAVFLYGLGQKIWGWPAFLTMNEEFAKGLPLYLGPQNRVPSTFAGHYDLAAWLVVIISLFGSLVFGFKNRFQKGTVFFVGLIGFILLLFTASRISFIAYLLAISLVLFLQKKKWLIVPVIIISFLLMNMVTGTASRFGKTFRVERVVYDVKTGKPIAAVEDESKIGEVITEEEETAKEELPLGTGFIPLRAEPEATQVAVIKKPVLTSLKTATKASEIATISGEFLIRRSLVYDISFTTRFQGTWPRAFEALGRNPLLGSGYSSISLATDNSYFRALGETGFLGLAAFLGIFLSFFLLVKKGLEKVKKPLPRSLMIGTSAGLAGLMFNAILIDVFEASKVAFLLWPLLGITAAVINFQVPKQNSLFKEFKKAFNLPIIPYLVLPLVGLAFFASSFSHYFVGDDFTWFRWAATTAPSELSQVFLDAKGFFYRPLAKLYFYYLYPFFSMRPSGYHLFSFGLHLGTALGAYFLILRLTKRKAVAMFSALLFLIHPLNAEPVLWMANTSSLMASFFYVGGVLSYLQWRQNSQGWRRLFYLITFLALVLGLASHELALTLPLILITYDCLFLSKSKLKNWRLGFLNHLPFLILIGFYFWLRNGVAGAHGLSGDYNYNLKNLPFNLIGNYLGYLGETIFSFRFLTLYDAARNYLRIHKLLTFLIAGGGLLSFGLIYKKIKPGRPVVFFFLWSLVLLMPFLGLGNIAERHAYLAKLGFITLIFWVFDRLYHQFEAQKRVVRLSLLILFVVCLFFFYGWEMHQAKREWHQAGEISNGILLALGTNYTEFPLNSRLYFLNLPIRYGRAWVFPVGFEDGLWFIYRDDTLAIEKPADLETTLDLAEGKSGHYVFVFEGGKLKEATR